jgi:hypothetical protein
MFGDPRRRKRLELNPLFVTSAALLVLVLVLSACSRKNAVEPAAIAAVPAYSSPTSPALVTPIITPIPTATNTPTPLPTPTPNGYWPDTAEPSAAHS